MTAKNILTYNSKITKLKHDYFSPIAKVGINDQPLSTHYCFLSRVVPWANTNIWTGNPEPDTPLQNQKYLKEVFKNIIVAKKINSSDISLVIQRIDWSSGVTYDIYRDDIDLFEEDDNGFLINVFYVRNKFDQIFKCLWNNNGSPSTDEPYFQPGSYGTNNIFTGSDKYKWKYIYTINKGSKIKFMDSNWIPVPINNNPSNPLLSTAACGNIDVINITNSGYGYDKSSSVITVNIKGDGVGASANVEVSNGHITNVIVDNTGSDYTYANVTIVSSNTSVGSGATVYAPISPVGGHGFDPLSELGCRHIMYTCEFNDVERVDGIEYLPTDIDYRQIGLLVDPVALSTSPSTANSAIYKGYSEILVSSGRGTYLMDELIFQGTSINTATFIGTVLSFEPATNIIKVLNTSGSIIKNGSIFGNTSKAARTVMNINSPDLVHCSGQITYIENRDSIQRSSDSIEQFRFVLHY